MASKDQSYTSEFKASVALEALAQKKRNLDVLSEKYDVPVSLILTWAVQLERNASNIYATTTAPTDIDFDAEEKDAFVDVDIEDEEVSHSFSTGVMGDDLDVKKLAFWSVLGIIFIVIFVQGLKEMYDITTTVNRAEIAANNEYHDVTSQKEQSLKELSSFGVVDIEKGIYHVPIDTVINEMAADSKY